MRAGIAQRRGRAGFDAEHLSVGAEQHGLQQARAFAALFEHVAEPRREPLDRAEHVALMRDRLGKALLGERDRQRQPRRDRLVLDAERLVEPAHEIGAEARRERRARPVEHVGDALEPDL